MRPSAASVAGGLACVADIDAHQVVAVDAATGRERWRFTAGGWVPLPPTIHQGLCLFGAHDGWVYAVRADDGTARLRLTRPAPAVFDGLAAASGRLDLATTDGVLRCFGKP
jgi:outer membrane protein assembly factor BamB